MTGNIVLLGFGLAGSGGLPVIAPLISLAAFLLGAGAGGVLAARTERHEYGTPARALVIEVTAMRRRGHRGGADRRHLSRRFSGDLVIALLALAMGVRNATVRQLRRRRT